MHCTYNSYLEENTIHLYNMISIIMIAWIITIPVLWRVHVVAPTPGISVLCRIQLVAAEPFFFFLFCPVWGSAGSSALPSLPKYMHNKKRFENREKSTLLGFHSAESPPPFYHDWLIFYEFRNYLICIGGNEGMKDIWCIS